MFFLFDILNFALCAEKYYCVPQDDEYPDVFHDDITQNKYVEHKTSIASSPGTTSKIPITSTKTPDYQRWKKYQARILAIAKRKPSSKLFEMSCPLRNANHFYDFVKDTDNENIMATLSLENCILSLSTSPKIDTHSDKTINLFLSSEITNSKFNPKNHSDETTIFVQKTHELLKKTLFNFENHFSSLLKKETDVQDLKFMKLLDENIVNKNSNTFSDDVLLILNGVLKPEYKSKKEYDALLHFRTSVLYKFQKQASKVIQAFQMRLNRFQREVFQMSKNLSNEHEIIRERLESFDHESSQLSYELNLLPLILSPADIDVMPLFRPKYKQQEAEKSEIPVNENEESLITHLQKCFIEYFNSLQISTQFYTVEEMRIQLENIISAMNNTTLQDSTKTYTIEEMQIKLENIISTITSIAPQQPIETYTVEEIKNQLTNTISAIKDMTQKNIFNIFESFLENSEEKEQNN